MAIISQETWDNMPEVEKEKIRKDYRSNLEEINNDGSEADIEYKTSVATAELYFGKENLREPKRPKIWDDMEELHEDIDTAFVELEETLANIDCETKLFNKILATYQIQHLIKLGYGGMITQEEWANNHITKFYVDVDYRSADEFCHYETDDDYHFIAFHTAEQRREFMSYPENRKLVQQYYEL